MNTSSVIKKISIVFFIVFFIFNAFLIAKPPSKLFLVPPNTVTPGSYGKSAHVGEINLDVLSRGLKVITLQLPNETSIQLERTSFENRGSGDRLWKGHVVDYDNSQVVLTIKKGQLVGRISFAGEVYEILPSKGNKHIVKELNQEAFPQCDVEFNGSNTIVQSDILSEQTQSPVTSEESSNIVTIDLLSVYTPNARSSAGGTTQIEALIQAAIDNANTAFIESNMNARYRLVHTAEVNHPPQASTGDALSVVTNDANVAALRDQYGADMVSFIVDTPNSCGTAWVQRNPGSSFVNYAFQATDIHCAVGNLTFAHEHGHNMGMEHNPENSGVGSEPEKASYLWSFAHYVNGSYRTVMSYSSPCSNGCTRVMRFSNPNINYAGVPTGVVNEKENARTGDLTTPIISDFRSTVVPQNGIINVRVNQSSDDVEESLADGSMYLNSTDLEFGYDSYVSSEQVLGLRFLNVSIPQGSTITNAYLEFSADETVSTLTSSVIQVEDTNSAAGFTTNSYDLTNRVQTNTSINWTIPEWTNGNLYQSPDISSLVQEVVNKTSWNSGGSLVFIINASGDRTSSSYDGNSSLAPLLHVEFDENTTPTNEVPSVSFTSSVSNLTVNFTDTSTDSDGTIELWDWDFGDSSNNSSVENPTHTYSTSGSYTVSLTVTDDKGATNTTTSLVSVSEPDTQAPTITAPSDISVEATGSTTVVSLGTAEVNDNIDPNPTVSNNAPSSFGLGLTTVTWTATDLAGNSSTDTQSVTVTDTTPPLITAPSNISVESSEPISINLVIPTVSDLVDSNPNVSNDAPALFPLGVTTVTWTAIDTSNNESTSTQLVTVIEPTPQPPLAPSNLSSTADKSGKGKNKTINSITLNWSDNSDNEIDFIVEGCDERTTGKGRNRIVTCNFNVIGTTSSNITSFSVSDVSLNRFRVKAINSIGESAYSNETKL